MKYCSLYVLKGNVVGCCLYCDACKGVYRVVLFTKRFMMPFYRGTQRPHVKMGKYNKSFTIFYV
jgi:hypothetical protein